MTMSEKLLGGLFFFLMAPALVILAPTTISLAVIAFISLIFGVRSLRSQTRRCLKCGHIFRLKPIELVKSATGHLDCPSCGASGKQAKFEKITR